MVRLQVGRYANTLRHCRMQIQLGMRLVHLQLQSQRPKLFRFQIQHRAIRLHLVVQPSLRTPPITSLIWTLASSWMSRRRRHTERWK